MGFAGMAAHLDPNLLHRFPAPLRDNHDSVNHSFVHLKRCILNKFIKESHISQSDKINTNVILLHITVNCLSCGSLAYLMWNLYKFTNNQQSCEEMLNNLIVAPRTLLL